MAGRRKKQITAPTVLDTEEFEKLFAQLEPQRWASDSPDIWNKLRSVNAIEYFIDDFQTAKYRYYLVHAGRRSFKSELAKRLLIWSACQNEKQTLVYSGPTLHQTSRIAWEDLKVLLPAYMIKKVLEVELEIRLINGSKIRIAGLDVPERIEGQRLNGIVIDEMGDVKNEVFRVNVLPALADTNGWAILTGTPNGARGEFYEIYQALNVKGSLLPDYGLYHWTTAQVRGSEFVEPYKVQMSQVQFDQEWNGLFVAESGLAYNFDRNKHLLNESYSVVPSLPIDISCDFNVNILPWVLSQSTADLTICFDEVTTFKSSLFVQVSALKQALINHLGFEERAKNHLLRFYGDASGSYIRDPAATQTAWQAIKNEFRGWRVQFNTTSSNPRIGDRLFSVNARLETADQKNHLLVSPQCRQLIGDFESITLKDITEADKERSGWERSHASDGLGYYIWKEFSSRRKANVQSIRAI